MSAQAINALIARYAACLARHDAEGAANCVRTPTAIFFHDRVNVLNTHAEVVEVIEAYLSALKSNGLDRIEIKVKAQSMDSNGSCAVWADCIMSQAKGKVTAEVSVLPKIAERRGIPRQDAQNARSRNEYAAFTALGDQRLCASWAKLVSAKLKQGRGTAEFPNDIFADRMRVNIEDESITLRSSVGFYAYLGGFQARLAMAGALESSTSFETIATNQNQDVLLHGKWVWTGEDGQKFHLADVSYIFENQGKSHRMSAISFTDIDPIMRPSLGGVAAVPMARGITPRRLAPAADH